MREVDQLTDEHLANGVRQNGHKVVCGQANGRPGSFDIDRYAGNRIPKIHLEQKLTLKRSFYGKIAFLTRTLSSKSYTLKQQQHLQQQQLQRQQLHQQKSNKLGSQLNAFHRENEASEKENDIISRTAANHHYASAGCPPVISCCDEERRLGNNERQLANESSHRSSLIKKANTKLTGNRLIGSCNMDERHGCERDGYECNDGGRDTGKRHRGGRSCDVAAAGEMENENLKANHLEECSVNRLGEEDLCNNNQQTHWCSTCDRAANVTSSVTSNVTSRATSDSTNEHASDRRNKQRNNQMNQQTSDQTRNNSVNSNGHANMNGSKRSENPGKCPSQTNAGNKQMSLIKDEQQSAQAAADKHDRENKHGNPDGNVPGSREQQRSGATQSGRQSDVQTAQSSRPPDEANGVQLVANRRQPLLNKFRCDYCFGLSASSKITCAGCRTGSRKASHSSVQSSTINHGVEFTNLDGHLGTPHLVCPQHSNLAGDLNCKDNCKLIKSADNRLANGGDALRGSFSGRSNERPFDQRPYDQRNGTECVCLSTGLSGKRLISETNLSELDNLTSSPTNANRPADRRTSPSPGPINPASPSIHRYNHAHLSSNSSNLLSNKLTSCSSSPDQTANSRASPERLTLELVKKSSSCSSKSFRSIKSIEIRDDLSVSGDPRREKAPDTGQGSVESPTKLNTARSHFNYPRKLRNKLNASIHGSRSVRFHTKALFTTLTILGTYLVCIMPALSKYYPLREISLN